MRGRRGSGIPVDPERIRAARRELGLSLAAVAGGKVSRTFIHQIEQGSSSPSAEVLRHIARKLGKPPSYFIPTRQRGLAPAVELAGQLTAAANLLRKVARAAALTESERQAVREVQYLIRRARALAKAIGQQSTAR